MNEAWRNDRQSLCAFTTSKHFALSLFKTGVMYPADVNSENPDDSYDGTTAQLRHELIGVQMA